MINAKATLIRLNINNESVAGAVLDVHDLVDRTSQTLYNALDLIEAITTIRPPITDPMVALTVAQYVAQTAVQNELFDPQEAIDAAIKHHNAILERHPYLRATTVMLAPDEQLTEIEGADTQVVVKANGKIKKGGKQILASELYKSHVIDATEPLDNKQFIQLLMSQLGMSKSGATTYAWNCRNQFAPTA